MKSSLLALAATILTAGLVSPDPHSPTVVLAHDNSEILRQHEAEFMKSTAEHGSKGYMFYYAENAVEVPDDSPVLQGKESIAKTMGFLDDKQSHLTWTPIGSDISASGDLGYTYGNYEFRSIDKSGKAVTAYGKYTSIWKKQGDGSWKVVLDMGNSSPKPTS